MLGHKPRVFQPHSEVCLDDLVPQDNFFRQVEGCLDLDFIRDLVCDGRRENRLPNTRQFWSLSIKLLRRTFTDTCWMVCAANGP